MKTTHDVAVALAVFAIAFFLLGFIATIVLLMNALLPPITQVPTPPETVVQYLLYITIFEAMSALPCTLISFGIKMSE